MRKHRVLCAVLSAALGAALLCAPLPETGLMPFLTAQAQTTKTYGDLTYCIEDGEVIITGCDNEAVEVVVPDTIEGLPVTQLRRDDDQEQFLFSRCKNLVSITLSAHITSLPQNCFSNHRVLEEITLPAELRTIGNNCFWGCCSLKSITLPESVEVIDHAFCGCSALTEVTIPEGVREMPGSFQNCSALTAIRIPASVTDLGEEALFGCTALETITVDPENAAYCSIDDALLTKDGSILMVYPAGNPRNSYALPETVTAIEQTALWDAKNLHHITIPEGVTCLDAVGGQFARCRSLETLTLPKSLVKIGKGTFGQNTLTDIYYAGSMVDWGAIDIADSHADDNPMLRLAELHFAEEDTAEHTRLTLYTAPDVLEVPAEFAAYQIEAASPDAAYKRLTGNAAEVSDKGLVTPTGGEREAVIQIDDGGEISFLHVTSADYSQVYADAVISEFLETHITEEMNALEKLQIIGELPAFMDYSSIHDSYAEMIAYNTGNCIGSSTMLVEMCRRLGIKAWVRNANRDPNTGSAHVNALAELDGVWYELEAGYGGTAPRVYTVTERTSLYKYAKGADEISVYQYDGIRTGETALEIPDAIDGETVTAVGDSFLKENPWVRSVTVPDTVTEISESAFPDFQGILFGGEGSAAEQFAAAHGITFRVTGSLVTGDVNADRSIDILDVIAVNKHLLGSAMLSTSQKAAADADADSEITPTDSLMILKYVVELVDSLE